jgi:hypothetical protein
LHSTLLRRAPQQFGGLGHDRLRRGVQVGEGLARFVVARIEALGEAPENEADGQENPEGCANRGDKCLLLILGDD